MDPAVDHFYACINPILPEVRQYLTSVLTELVKRYPDLDGLHYDYIRYPSDAGDFSYDEASLKDFANRNHDMTPSRSITRWRRWRCNNVERLLGDQPEDEHLRRDVRGILDGRQRHGPALVRMAGQGSCR